MQGSVKRCKESQGINNEEPGKLIELREFRMNNIPCWGAEEKKDPAAANLQALPTRLGERSIQQENQKAHHQGAEKEDEDGKEKERASG